MFDHHPTVDLVQNYRGKRPQTVGGEKFTRSLAATATNRMSILHRVLYTSYLNFYPKIYVSDPRLLSLARSMSRDPLPDPHFRISTNAIFQDPVRNSCARSICQDSLHIPCLRIPRKIKTLESLQDPCLWILYTEHLRKIHASGFLQEP